MRERRWESRLSLPFDQVLSLCERLAQLGLHSAKTGRDIIVYVEDWTISDLDDIHRLSSWPFDDMTMVRTHENWTGDFFLLAGGYHTIYQKHKGSGTYCSISHPWRMAQVAAKHHPLSMAWSGFRGRSHSFLRVRLHTVEVVTPGETREDPDRDLWLDERRHGFKSAIDLLELPITIQIENNRIVLKHVDPMKPLFCSWPDAFGPCQFEYHSSDPFELLVPATRLADTHGGTPTAVRVYLSGFGPTSLKKFEAISPDAHSAYRASLHCRLEDLPEIRQIILPNGRIYTTLCEFKTKQFLDKGEDAWAIIGVMGHQEGFKVEVRLSRAPLEENKMADWLEALLGMPVEYSPLPPFP